MTDRLLCVEKKDPRGACACSVQVQFLKRVFDSWLGAELLYGEHAVPCKPNRWAVCVCKRPHSKFDRGKHLRKMSIRSVAGPHAPSLPPAV